MHYKIGIFGSAVLDSEETITKAHALGKALSKYTITLITGAGKGLPYQVVSLAKRLNKNIKIWGFPPVLDKQALEEYTTDDVSIYDKLTYVPKSYAFAGSIHARRLYRNAASTSNCDAGIIISGRWGTLNEFTNLQEGGKIIGVMTGTGGVADELPNIVTKVKKQTNASVFFSDDPNTLLKTIMEELAKKNQKQ